MTRGLTPLGHARVYRDPRSGELVVDADTIRRTQFAGDDFGEDDIEGDDDFEGEDDDFGEDDIEGDDDDVSGEDDIEGEDDDVSGDDDIEGDEVGRRRRRKKNRKNRRGNRQSSRRSNRRSNRSSNQRPTRRTSQAVKRDNDNDSDWGMTAVSGTTTLAAAGAASVTIRLQHHFKAKDITFDGSANGAKVTSIFFGDRAVWSNSAGIPVSVFGSSSFMRNLLKGQSMHAGLDIVVNGTLTGAGDFAVTILGYKPVNKSC